METKIKKKKNNRIMKRIIIKLKYLKMQNEDIINKIIFNIYLNVLIILYIFNKLI